MSAQKRSGSLKLEKLVDLLSSWRDISRDFTEAQNNLDDLFSEVKIELRLQPSFGNKCSIEHLLYEEIGKEFFKNENNNKQKELVK